MPPKNPRGSTNLTSSSVDSLVTPSTLISNVNPEATAENLEEVVPESSIFLVEESGCVGIDPISSTEDLIVQHTPVGDSLDVRYPYLWQKFGENIQSTVLFLTRRIFDSVIPFDSSYSSIMLNYLIEEILHDPNDYNHLVELFLRRYL